MRALAIGDLNVDLFLPFGIPPMGKQVFVRDSQISGGGCAANFAVACAKLGAKSKLIARIGKDVFGKFLLEELRRHGVDDEDITVSEDGKTGVSIALVERADRSIITYRGENAAFSEADMKETKIDADLVHIPSFFILEGLRPIYSKLARKAHEAGAVVSFDTGWDPLKKWSKTEYFSEALKSSDIFLPNIYEARAILNEPKWNEKKLAEKFLQMGVKAVAIKTDKRGSFVADDSKSAEIPPFKVNVVDPTGAGDVFDAAFLLPYICGKDVISSGRFANAAAAIKIAGSGWSSYPTLAQVNQLLQKNGFAPINI